MALFGARARGGHRRRVQRGLATEPVWQVQVHGKWICPFCATLAVRVPEGGQAALVEEIVDHLDDGCPQFLNGDGELRPLNELRRLAQYRHLRRQVKNQLLSNPAWQLIDVSRRWFCPFCGEATGVLIPPDRKMTEEILQGLIDHVETCYAYDRGKGQEKPFAHLKAIVKYVNQSRKLTENVRTKLEGDPAWRRKDPQSRWICPYCLVPQEHIDLSSNLIMFENAPGLIAKHLAAACDEFREGGEPKPLDAPARSASSQGRTVEEKPWAPPLQLDAPEPRLLESDEDDPEGLFQRRAPSSPRTGSSIWGKDGITALNKQANRGTTLRELENSGEYLLVDDELKTAGGRSSQTPEDKTRAVRAWRDEIERELASVNQALPNLEELDASAPTSGRGQVEAAQPALIQSLSEHGLEVGVVEMRASPPQGGFAEVLDLGQGRAALMAGGVTGEETESAMISAQARELLRRYAAPDADPGDVLRSVNADIFADLDGRSFVAVSYVLVDIATARIRFARAGLSPPVVVNPRRNPRLRSVDSEGMVMGIDRGPIFDHTLQVKSLELSPGDMIVLFSNGVLEARGANRDEFGLERTHDLVTRYGTHEVEYFTDKFQEYLSKHLQSPSRLLNDACVVALRLEAKA